MRLRWLLAALLAGCGDDAPPAPFDPRPAEQALPVVAAALRDGDGATALAELDRAAAAGPLPDGALLLRAMALDLSGLPSQAQAALREELDAHPGDGRARALLAGHLLEAGQLEAAAAEIELARQLAPRDVLVRLMTGRLALQRREDEAALRAFQDVLADDPWGAAAVEAHAGLGAVLEHRGPTEAAVGKQHAQASSRLKEMRAAIADARAKLRRNATDVEASYLLASAWLAMYREFGDSRLRDEAEAALLRMLELAPADSRALFNLGFLRATQKRFEEALDLSRQAVAADPHNLLARVNLSLLLAQTRRQDEAVEHMLVVAMESPDVPNKVRAHADIAHMLSSSADPAQRALAASHARIGLDLMPSDPYSLRKLLDRLEPGVQAPPEPSQAGPR